VRISFHTNLDEAHVWLQYLTAWDDDVIPPVGSEIVIKHPSYDCHLTLRVCGYRFIVDVDEKRLDPRRRRIYECEVELNIPTFLHSIQEWEDWYRRHFK